MRREAFRYRARARDQQELTGDDTPAIEDEGLVSAVDRADLQRALKTLNPPDRLLMRLRYEEDLTQPVIARLLDLPEGTVKVRLHRARSKLRLAYEYGDQPRENDR